MKNSIFKTVFTSLLVVMCISWGSCGKTDTDDDNALKDDTFLTAKVDGVDYSINETVVAVARKDDGIE